MITFDDLRTRLRRGGEEEEERERGRRGAA